MIEQVQAQVAQRMQWALNHPTSCLAPYTTVDVRHSESSSVKIFQTCCCNLDASLFVPSSSLR
jgi:hypothetical protein